MELKKGTWPDDTYEVVVSENNKYDMPLNKEISTKVNGHKLKVVGYYADKSNSNFMLVNDTTIQMMPLVYVFMGMGVAINRMLKNSAEK